MKKSKFFSYGEGDKLYGVFKILKKNYFWNSYNWISCKNNMNIKKLALNKQYKLSIVCIFALIIYMRHERAIL